MKKGLVATTIILALLNGECVFFSKCRNCKLADQRLEAITPMLDNWLYGAEKAFDANEIYPNLRFRFYHLWPITEELLEQYALGDSVLIIRKSICGRPTIWEDMMNGAANMEREKRWHEAHTVYVPTTEYEVDTAYFGPDSAIGSFEGVDFPGLPSVTRHITECPCLTFEPHEYSFFIAYKKGTALCRISIENPYEYDDQIYNRILAHFLQFASRTKFPLKRK